MREHDDVSPAHFVGPGRHLLELLHHRPRRRQQRAPEGIRVTLLSRVRVFITEEYLRLPAGGEEVASLVRGGLNAALAPVIGVEQHAGAERFVIREQARDAAVEPAHIDANAHLHLEQRDDVLDGRVPEAEPLPQFRGVILGLRADVALQEWPLRRVVADALHAQEVLEFYLRAREARQQVRRIVDGSIVVAIDLAEARREVDMDGLTTQKRIDRCPEDLRELLQLVDADAALALLDRDRWWSARRRWRPPRPPA